ncbi:MAG: phosphopantothenoylcysteine decarboxylase, partial [Sedimenticola sp.]
RVEGCDLFVACAAVADYRPESVVGQKIKKSREEMTLRLVRNPDILAQVAALPDGPFTVGFAAETERPVEHAEEKRCRKGVDMMAANLVGGDVGGFDRDENALTVLWAGGRCDLPMANKLALAERLVTRVTEHYEQRDTTKNT